MRLSHLKPMTCGAIRTVAVAILFAVAPAICLANAEQDDTSRTLSGFDTISEPSVATERLVTDQNSEKQPEESLLADVKNWVEIGFYVIIAFITILTFRQAKKTILQPIRAEVFKMQLRELADLLGLFHGKGEIDLRNDFGFEDMFYVNCRYVTDQYARAFFDVAFDPDRRPYNKHACPTAIMLKDAAFRETELMTGHYVSEKTPPRSDHEQLQAYWEKYQHGGTLYFPRQTSEMDRRLRAIKDSPILTSQCRGFIADYLLTVEKNVTVLSEVLHNSARQFQSKYKTLNDLNSISFDWIRHEYLQQFEPLDQKAKQIVRHVESYLKVDDLMTT